MMTGDARAVADSVATELGIDVVFLEVLPDEKSAKIEELKHSGKRVGMVGDSVNDAPALVTADVGIAIGAGTAVAVEAGDIVLVRSDPRDVPRIIDLSKASYRKMIQNLAWATVYNVIAIPLAAGVLARWGIVLSPAIGAVLMSVSTVMSPSTHNCSGAYGSNEAFRGELGLKRLRFIRGKGAWIHAGRNSRHYPHLGRG